MHTVIRLLETLALDVDAVVDPGSALADAPAAARDALLDRDPVALARALGYPAVFACMVAVPDQDAPLDAPDRQDGPDELPVESDDRAAD